jgi:hypothetical protein
MVKEPFKKYAIVRISDGFVVNSCIWDGSTPWNDLPNGQEEMECPNYVGPGWLYQDGDWLPPPPPVEPDPPPEG